MQLIFTLIVLSLFQLINFAYAEIHHSLDLTTGYSYISYEETHENQDIENTKFTENTFAFETSYQILFFDFLFFKGRGDYFAFPKGSSTGQTIELLDGFGSIGLIVPGSRPFKISLIGESFYSEMKTNSTTFGYKSMNGSYIYPLIDYTTKGGSSIYVKFPIFSNVRTRSELTVGTTIHFTVKETLPYPYFAYQESAIFKIEYSKIELEFGGVRKINTTLESITASIGYLW